jgi:hypothetical protein
VALNLALVNIIARNVTDVGEAVRVTLKNIRNALIAK